MEDLINEFRIFEDIYFINDDNKIAYTEDYFPVHTVYVSRLHQNTNKEELREHFAKFGTINNIVLCQKYANYAFITFEKPEDAYTVLRNRHIMSQRLVRVDKADSWHQPKYPKQTNVTDSTENQEDQPSLFMLNIDCFMHIFSYLDVFELHNFIQSCQYFKDLPEIHNKCYKTLDVSEINYPQPITLMRIKNLLRDFGSYVITLKFSGIRFSTPTVRVVELIPRYCKNIKHLTINGFTILYGTLQKFRHIFEKLETLELINCVITDRVKPYLALAKNLKSLNLTLNHEITGKCLTTFRNLENLNLLHCTNIQPKYFSQFLKNNKSLKYLNIGQCPRLNQQNIDDMVINLTELEHLVISNMYSNINSNNMAQLAKLPKLKKIQIIKNGYLDLDSLFMELVNENKLEHLDITDGILSNENLKHLQKFTKLKFFKLTYKLNLSDSLLNSLVSKNDLETVYLTGCNSITNDGLIEFIKNCPNLKYLDVSGCPLIGQQFLFDANEYLSKNQPKHNRKIEIICGYTNIDEEIHLENVKVSLKSSFEFQSFEDIDLDDSWLTADYDYDSEFGSEYDEHELCLANIINCW